MDRTLTLTIALALGIAACSPDFDPASKVEKLRVLAVRAEPPEIEPASNGAVEAPDRAVLGALVVRADAASEPTRQTTVVYVACLPAPGTQETSLCVQLAALRDPTGVLAALAAESCAGAGAPVGGEYLLFAGAEVCEGRSCGPVTAGGVTLPSPELALPTGYDFAALAQGAPDRILGVQAVVLAFALDAAPDELVPAPPGACPQADVAARLSALWGSREHVLSTKRVRVRGPEAPDAPNQNPAVDDIAVGGSPLPALVTQGTHALAPLLPPDADARHEAYSDLDAAGVKIGDSREEWVTSWFSTAGELDELHARDGEVDPWTVWDPGPTTVVAVVRDLRGGVAWCVRDVTVAP